MATSAQVAIETYLKTSYHPDRDYVDGEIEERNSDEFDHAELQTAIARTGAYMLLPSNVCARRPLA